MSAVAAPDARHHHDDQHGVELEDEQSPRVPESATETLPEAEKFEVPQSSFALQEVTENPSL